MASIVAFLLVLLPLAQGGAAAAGAQIAPKHAAFPRRQLQGGMDSLMQSCSLGTDALGAMLDSMNIFSSMFPNLPPGITMITGADMARCMWCARSRGHSKL